MQSNILTTIDLDLTITYFNLQSDSTLTNGRDADTSIASCAYFVNRNTGVFSIFLHSDVKHTRATVTSKVAIKVEVISMSIRVGICTTVKLIIAVSPSTVVLIGVVNRAKAFGKSIKIKFKYIFAIDLRASQERITKGSTVYFCW